MIQWYADATLKMEPTMTCILQVIQSANKCPNMYVQNSAIYHYKDYVIYLTGYRLITDYIIL